MRSAVLTHLPRVARPHRLPRAPIALRARLRAGSLDRQLASGTAPWQTPVLAARALQLTSQRKRRNIARSLDRLAEVSEQPASPRFSAVVPVSRSQVRGSRPAIRSIAQRLRDGAPIDARGVARVIELMSDGSGPFFVAGTPQTLSAALDDVSRRLGVND
jgi:hypothetical protein